MNDNSSKSLFDFVNAIYTDQSSEFFDGLSDHEKKTYKNSRYMINRLISMNPVYAPIVNAVQQYQTIPDRQHYMFLTSMLPKGKQYSKYIKNDKSEKYEPWLISLVAKHFTISEKNALEYIEIYYLHDKDALRNLCRMYAVDSKLLKKAKLV